MRDGDRTNSSLLPNGRSLFNFQFFLHLARLILFLLSISHESAHMNVTFEFELRCFEFGRSVVLLFSVCKLMALQLLLALR